MRAEEDHYWAQYVQAMCLVKTGKWAEAKAGLTACLSRRPDFIPALIARGIAHSQLGDRYAGEGKNAAAKAEFEAAEADYRKVLEKASDPLVLYSVRVNRSALWAQQKRWNAAEADLEEAIRLRPKDFLAYLSRGGMRRQRNDLKGAIAALDQAVACRPDEAALYYTRGRAHLERKDWAAARADLEQTIARTPAGRDKSALPAPWWNWAF